MAPPKKESKPDDKKQIWQVQKAQAQFPQPVADDFWLLLMLFFDRQKAEIENKPEEKEKAEKALSELYGIDKPDEVYPRIIKDAEKGDNPNPLRSLNQSYIDSESLKIRRADLFSAKCGDRQKVVLDTLNDAAKAAGVNIKTMCGMWGVESSFGKSLTSPSNCQGDWQFTRGTWADMIKRHGSEIAAGLRAKNSEMANQVESYHRMLQGGVVGGPNYQAMLALRNDPAVSTFAAAFYLKDVAQAIGVKADQYENAGVLYAGYNVGPAAARRLKGDLNDDANVGRILGSVAKWNPIFYEAHAGKRDFTLTGQQALDKYKDKVDTLYDSFKAKFSNFIEVSSAGGIKPRDTFPGTKLDFASSELQKQFPASAAPILPGITPTAPNPSLKNT